ncbi:thiamine diphosphokinase [Candidatus Cryosericum septentrionale]|jgi:thiamine pyrophosphokinase|uniref:Thiamine diphosphokinase n=1 Tax=Candidatus Cryosericum septentrionale TaxID=2290913 RepID=A0A398E2J0_9BACT|nr:thiamine diphosphokinase [Candidatus Cryosericum septentrionale]RIE16851.1 thiamine diphosphokinase [Candidatus Cryosericum septentrionale]
MPAVPTIVFAGGDPGSFSYLRTVDYADAFLVAVDRGLAVMAELGLTPDLFVGDGDSVVPELLAGLDRSRTRVVILPAHKDVSDLEAAFDLLVTMGRQGSVLVLAGLGGRLDHCLFNFQLAARHLADFEDITFEDDRCLVRPLTSSNALQLPARTTVSFVPVTREVELSLTGFEYPLLHAVVQRGSTRTLSNVACGLVQQVIVERGTVVMIAWKVQSDIP